MNSFHPHIPFSRLCKIMHAILSLIWISWFPNLWKFNKLELTPVVKRVWHYGTHHFQSCFLRMFFQSFLFILYKNYSLNYIKVLSYQRIMRELTVWRQWERKFNLVYITYTRQKIFLLNPEKWKPDVSWQNILRKAMAPKRLFCRYLWWWQT
jgi:hypothetical protein